MIYSKSFLAIGNYCFVHDIPVLRMRDKYRSQLPVNVAYVIVHVYRYIYYARLVRAQSVDRELCTCRDVVLRGFSEDLRSATLEELCSSGESVCAFVHFNA